MENSREGPRGPGSWARGSAFTLGAKGKPVIDLMGDFRVGRMPQCLLNGYDAGRLVRGPSPPLISPLPCSEPRSGASQGDLGPPCSTPTATEFFMSATAEVNSLKCSSGQ